MEKKQINKKIVIIAIVLFILLVSGSVFVLSNRKTKQEVKKTPMEQQDVIPTIDSSVVVGLKKAPNNKEVILTISNIPNSTKTVDYELSYNTEKQGLQGVIGTAKVEAEKKKDYEKQITLGTCSSGRCVYHDVLGAIKLNLRFTGDYGERIFDKEYSI